MEPTPGEQVLTLQIQWQALVDRVAEVERRQLAAALRGVEYATFNGDEVAAVRPLTDDEVQALARLRLQADSMLDRIEAIKAATKAGVDVS